MLECCFLPLLCIPLECSTQITCCKKYWRIQVGRGRCAIKFDTSTHHVNSLVSQPICFVQVFVHKFPHQVKVTIPFCPICCCCCCCACCSGDVGCCIGAMLLNTRLCPLEKLTGEGFADFEPWITKLRAG